MNKNQFLGLTRAALLSVGAFITTLGVSDGNAWLPVVGVIMSLVSLGWGVWWHKDPATPGLLKWSLVRKLVNALGSAAAAYGYQHPEQIAALSQVVAALGPVLAVYFSWISNAPDNDEPDVDGGPGSLHPLIILGFLLLFLPSCAGDPFRLATKYGTITQDKEGGLTARSKVLNLHRGPDGILTVRPKVKTLTINPDK